VLSLLLIGVAAPALGAQSKQITDPAEYNLYVAMLNEQNPAKKMQLVDEFLAKYPNTVVKEDALESKLVAAQQAQQPYEPVARALLQVNPKNLRALVVLAFVFSQQPPPEADPQFQQKVAEAESIAQRGLEVVGAAPKPENVSEADYQTSKKNTQATFHQTLGLVGLIRKDYPAAQNAFKQALTLSAGNATIAYRLAEAYRSEKPIKYTEALWAYAHVIGIEGPMALAPLGKQQVEAYLDKFYKSYHGSDEGLDKLKADAKAAAFPPDGFKVLSREEVKANEPPPPPAPVETDPTKMSFGQMKDVLAAGGENAKTLWGKLKGTALGLEGKIVSATPATRPRTVRLSVTAKPDDPAGAYDVELVLAAASLRPIAAGRTVEFEGTVNAYTESPISIRMVDGRITTPPPAAPKKPAAKKKG
jgi:tetratricopeptide (TPR) repeat protein